MGLHVSQRRLRRNINIEDAKQAYTALLQRPTNQALDNYVRQFDPPAGGRYVMEAADYDIARYLLAIVHCAHVPNDYQVFIDTLGLKLNNEMDAYRMALSKLERRMLDKAVVSESSVKAPAKTAASPSEVLSPLTAAKHELNKKVVERVRFV